MTDKKRVMALGFFDGIHVGHAELLNMANKRAAENDAIASVLTFDVHPDNLVFNKTVPLITSAHDREDIIRRMFGINDIVCIHFSQSVMHMDWVDFIKDLIDEMNLAWIVVGHDFRFGYKGIGTAEKLKAYCESRNVGCDIIPPVCRNDVIVSSTLIRQLLENGEVEKANELLGHPYLLSDTIRSGYHLGTKMGTPTINMRFREGVLVPKHGVYAAKVYLDDGTEHISVTNIGVRPTVSNDDSVSVESFILNFNGDLYGHRARVEFHSFLRPEMKFKDAEELSARIKFDADTTKRYFDEKNS